MGKQLNVSYSTGSANGTRFGEANSKLFGESGSVEMDRDDEAQTAVRGFHDTLHDKRLQTNIQASRHPVWSGGSGRSRY